METFAAAAGMVAAVIEGQTRSASQTSHEAESVYDWACETAQQVSDKISGVHERLNRLDLQTWHLTKQQEMRPRKRTMTVVLARRNSKANMRASMKLERMIAVLQPGSLSSFLPDAKSGFAD